MSDAGGGELAQIDAAAGMLRTRGAVAARFAFVLGSGLRDFARSIEDPVVVPFADVPHWPVPRVAGHGASVVFGSLAGTPVACLTGRVHAYEGWTAAAVARPVRTLRRLGIERFVLTNAAGGIDPDLRPGDLMLITDHLNLSGRSPLVGPHEPELGPRFPDQSRVWDAALSDALRRVDPGLRAGVYAGVLGPSYETPAEIRMLRALGAAAVGMSTVHEAIALNAGGARTAGVSLISNLAAGLAAAPLRHADVVAAGEAAAERLARLLRGLCQAAPPGTSKEEP